MSLLLVKLQHTSNNLNITNLAYKEINEKYSIATYLGLKCIMDRKTGYINATKFCSLASDESKRFDNYIANARYKKLFDYMESSPEYSGELSIQITAGSYELRVTRNIFTS